MLKLDWQWVNIIKPPKIHTIPDILTPVEIEQLIGKTRKLRYRIFLLTTYSMGLRLGEALSLLINDNYFSPVTTINTKKQMLIVSPLTGHREPHNQTTFACTAHGAVSTAIGLDRKRQ